MLALLARRGPETSAPHPADKREDSLRGALTGILRVEFVLILLMAVLRFWVQASTQAFLPKLLMEQGFSSTTYGGLAGLFMLGAAVGGIAGGILGDRIGSYPIMLGATALSVLPFFLLPVASGPLLPVLIVTAGLLNVAPHSLQVTMAQNALPGRGGLASGMILGSMFTLGGIEVPPHGAGCRPDWVDHRPPGECRAVCPRGCDRCCALGQGGSRESPEAERGGRPSGRLRMWTHSRQVVQRVRGACDRVRRQTLP